MLGWSTATARDRGNVSSLWRYKIGARLPASTAPLSVCAREPRNSMGRDGMWARGPHPPSDEVIMTSAASPRAARLISSRITATRTARQGSRQWRRSSGCRRADEKASSSYVQSRASSSSHQQRPVRVAAELSLLFGLHRSRSRTIPSRTDVACDPSVQRVWKDRTVCRQCGGCRLRNC